MLCRGSFCTSWARARTILPSLCVTTFVFPAMSRLFRSLACSLVAALTAGAAGAQEASCQPLYLMVATGDMHNARQIAQVLQRTKVPATFFAGNSPTDEGEAALSRHWGDWWRQIADDGHAMAVQPWDLPLLRGDLPPRRGGGFLVKVQTGVRAGKDYTWDKDKYCDALDEASRWMNFYSGQDALPLFHAPAGAVSPKLEKVARACGYVHVPWPAHFISAENVQSGATLLTHLGAQPGQSAEDAAKSLTQTLESLKGQGFCFKTLAEHPDYQQWVKQRQAAKSKPEGEGSN